MHGHGRGGVPQQNLPPGGRCLRRRRKRNAGDHGGCSKWKDLRQIIEKVCHCEEPSQRRRRGNLLSFLPGRSLFGSGAGRARPTGARISSFQVFCSQFRLFYDFTEKLKILLYICTNLCYHQKAGRGQTQLLCPRAQFREKAVCSVHHPPATWPSGNIYERWIFK